MECFAEFRVSYDRGILLKYAPGEKQATDGEGLEHGVGEIRSRAEAARQRALKRLHEKSGEIDFQRATLALQRSLTRIQVAPRVTTRRQTGPLEREISSQPTGRSK